MAHIAKCMTGTEPSSSISKSLSAHPDAMDQHIPQSAVGEKPFTWRMQHPQPPEQPRRYQFFPRERQLPVLNSSKHMDSEKASGIMANARDEKSSTATNLKNKISQHSLVRRRKISVPELGPMTTVQEIPMDSPTIPGRPPLHERSVSAPGGERQVRGHRNLTMQKEFSESGMDSLDAAIDESFSTTPKSPKQLAPLVIPPVKTMKPPQLLPQRSITHLRSGSAPDEAVKSGRLVESPYMRTPFTPQSSTTDLSTPGSASTNPLSRINLQTPISAPAMESHRFSPKPWDVRANTPILMERAITPQPVGSRRVGVTGSHRRGASESSSIMDRGRPRKRGEARQAVGSQLKERALSDQSAERKAFEELPSGAIPKEVSAKMSNEEIQAVRKQAYRQAERFEVLRAEEVVALSKELRHLDERTEYLRRTYTSLRTGRRNLHSRICQFLRSARVAKFSYESMLKQEEALAELDASIDDWVSKLEKAENRRMRVRQKLLEHVAAAAILPNPDSGMPPVSWEEEPPTAQASTTVHDISTPPRSPTKQGSISSRASSPSPSPQRVVARVPSAILEDPVVEEAEALGDDQIVTGPASLGRGDVESIRIYAGDDIYALLADVEKEITKMSLHTSEPSPEEMPESQRRALHREQSRELLNGLNLSVSPLDSPPAPTPPIKDFPTAASSPDGQALLSKAVFKP